MKVIVEGVELGSCYGTCFMQDYCFHKGCGAFGGAKGIPCPVHPLSENSVTVDSKKAKQEFTLGLAKLWDEKSVLNIPDIIELFENTLKE